jgi:hypothetical protein
MWMIVRGQSGGRTAGWRSGGKAMDGRSQVLWWVRQAEREVRCEIEPVSDAAVDGCYLILYIDGRLASCGFHTTRESLLTCARDLDSALRNIVWGDRDVAEVRVARFH